MVETSSFHTDLSGVVDLEMKTDSLGVVDAFVLQSYHHSSGHLPKYFDKLVEAGVVLHPEQYLVHRLVWALDKKMPQH
jgi:hypothetical protein